MEQKLIVREVDVDRNLCITIDEIIALIDHYSLCSPYRLMFCLLAVTGMRGCELENLKPTDFSRDFSKLTYKVYKPVKRVGKTGTITVVYKMRTVNIPKFLQAELTEFVRLNYHTFKGGVMFGLSSGGLRKQLQRFRDNIRSGKIKGDIYHGFLDQTDNVMEYSFSKEEENILKDLERDHFHLERRYKTKYRIALHSFRRFYVTFRLWSKYKGDLILTSRDIGHSKALDTTYVYTYSPDKIGLPEDCDARHTFDYFFSKGKTLKSTTKEVKVNMPTELIEKAEEIALKNNISINDYIRQSVFNNMVSA